MLDGAAERGLPTVERTCAAYGHDEAYWATKQLRAADESATILTICTARGETTQGG